MLDSMDVKENDTIAQRLLKVLGNEQKEFEGGVYADKLGSKIGAYGSFLPTELRAPSAMGQYKPAAAVPSAFTPKGRLSPADFERIGRIKATASVTDASCGGTSAVDKSLAGPRHSVPEHFMMSKNSAVGLDERNKEIQGGVLNSNIKEADLDSDKETNNNNHSSPLHRSRIFVSVSQKIVRSRGASVSGSIPVVEETSSKTQNSDADKDFDRMKAKKATLITLRIKKDAGGDNRNKNEPFYSGLRLNDSASLSPNEEHGYETYLSDAYSSPDSSPLTMIQVVRSCLQPKYPLLLSPLPELLVPPSDRMNAFLGFVEGSSAVLSSAVKLRIELEDCLEKSYTLNGGNKKRSLQAKAIVKTAELNSTLSDGVPRAQMEKKFIQEVNVDAHRNLCEISNEYEVLENVRQESVLDTRNLRQDAGLSLDATAISVHSLDPSNQQIGKKSDVFKKPVKTSKKEEGKSKLKDTTLAFESEKESDERRALEILTFNAKNMKHMNGQGVVQCKEVHEASTEANFSKEEFSKLHTRDRGAGKLDMALGEENGNDLCMKSSEGAKVCKGSSLRLGMADTSKDKVRDAKKNFIRKETSSKYPAREKCSDFSEMKESSTDCLTDTYIEREGKKNPSKKVFKQSAFALEKKAKDYATVAARELEHEHVTTSECHETGMTNFGKDLHKNDNFVRKELKLTQEAEKDGKLLEELATNNSEASFSNSDRPNLDVNTAEPIPAAPAGPGTLVLDTWVECEKCGRWRLLLPEMDANELPKTFFCKMLTWLPGMNSCKYEQDETSDAVYKKLGIPNPRLAQLSASAIHPQSASIQPASLMPTTFSSLYLSSVTEKPQETKSKAASNKKALTRKLPLGFSKCSFPRMGASGSVESKKLNDHVSEDHDQARVQGDEENKLSLLKFKRKQVKTSSAEELEGAPALKKNKLEERRFCSLKNLPNKSSSSAVFHDSRKTESSAALLNTRKYWKEGTTDGGVDCKRFLQSKALEEQPNNHSLFNAGGTIAEKHTNEVGDAKVKRMFKVRLKRDESVQNERKKRSEYEDSISQFRNDKRMKHNKADVTISRLCEGEIKKILEMCIRHPGPSGKECMPIDALQDQEQIKGVESTEKSLAPITIKEASEIGQTYLKNIEPENVIRGTSEVVDVSGEAAAEIKRRQRSLSPSLQSRPSQVSSPESSARKSKGPVSPLESTVSSSPMKSHRDRIGPSKQNARSRVTDYHSADVANEFRPDSGREMGNFCVMDAYPTLLDERGHQNRECNISIQGDKVPGDEHRDFCRGAGSLRERDRRDGRYDRHNEDEWLRQKDCSSRDRDFHDRIFGKWAYGKSFDGTKDKFAREKKVCDIRGRLSSGGSCSHQQFVVDRLDGMREGVIAGFVDSCSDGRGRHKDAICETDTEGAGKEKCSQSERDILRIAYRKEKSERLHWKDGQSVSARLVPTSPKVVTLGMPVDATTGSKEGEAFCTRIVHERHLFFNSESKIMIDREKQAGNLVPGTKFKNNDGCVLTTQSAVNSKRARELSKRVDECVESSGFGPKKTSPVRHKTSEADVGGASGMKAKRAHQASFLIKDAKDLKHSADRFKGSGAFRGDLYLHAALKFLQGAAILETCQDGGAKPADILSFYSGTAKLCEFCATLYAQDIQATALALKCAAVARMRELAFKNPSTSRNLVEIQATWQLPNPSPLGESPSSSASDLDNLNNQTFPDEKLQPTRTTKEVTSPSFQAPAISSIRATTWHHPDMTRILRDTGEVCAAFEAWRKADLAYAAAKVKFSDLSSEDVFKRVGEIGFSSVEVLVQLVKSALKALRG